MSVGPFALVPRAQAAPGRCLRCPRNENLIQLSGEQIPNFGIVYLCAICFSELANGMSYMPIADHERSQETVNRELQRFLLLAEDQRDQVDRAMKDIPLLKARISNGIHDLVDRTVSDFLAGDAGGDGVAVPVAVAPTELAGRIDPEPAAAELDDRAGADAGAAGGSTHLLDGIVGLGPRADRGSAGAVPVGDEGSGELGDAWSFIGESEPDEADGDADPDPRG